MQTLSLFDEPSDPPPPSPGAAAAGHGEDPAPPAAHGGGTPAEDVLQIWSQTVAARIYSDRKKGLKEVQADVVRWTTLVAAVGTIGQAKARSYGFALRGMPPEHTDEQFAELERATAVIHRELLVSNDIPLFQAVSDLDVPCAADPAAPRQSA